jgi:hypothetical protein
MSMSRERKSRHIENTLRLTGRTFSRQERGFPVGRNSFRRFVMTGPKPRPVGERFWEKVRIADPDECWEWQAGVKSSGYGEFRLRERTVSAHRMAYLLAVGPIPEGSCVLHECDNRTCVNPRHLHLGSCADNSSEAVARGRQAHNQVLGEKHGQAKLTKADVIAIRKIYAAGGGSYRQLGARFGVDRSNIGIIIKRKGWKWVEEARG